MIKNYKRFYESNKSHTLEEISERFGCRLEKKGDKTRLFFAPGEILLDDLIEFFELIAEENQKSECDWWSEGRDFVFEFEV